MVPFLLTKKPSVSIVGHKFILKFPWLRKAIKVKCPTYDQGTPSDLTLIDGLFQVKVQKLIGTALSEMRIRT